jgi:hypothetical protein
MVVVDGTLALCSQCPMGPKTKSAFNIVIRQGFAKDFASIIFNGRKDFCRAQCQKRRGGFGHPLRLMDGRMRKLERCCFVPYFAY